MKPIYLFKIFVSVAVPLLVLQPYFWYGQPISNENYMLRTWFVTGAYSVLGLEDSFQWISSLGFGLPRVSNPLYVSFFLPAYLGAYIPQPLFSYILWLGSMSVGMFGAWKLFSLFTDRRELVFLAGTCLILSGMFLNISILGLFVERVLFIPWTLYFFWRGLRENRSDLIVISSVLHALHFMAATKFTWFYVSTGIGFFLLGYSFHLARQSEYVGRVFEAFKSVFKVSILFFGLCALLMFVQIYPILEYESLAVHRDVPIEWYIRTGRLHLDEFLEAPFWFPGAFGDSRQHNFYRNLSYLGWVPIFLCILWLSSTPKKKILGVGFVLLCILFAAAGKTPVDEIIRALPGMGTIRMTSFWMIAWNFTLMLLAVEAGGKIGNTISLDKAYRTALLILVLNGAAALILLFMQGAEFSMEMLRPLIVGAIICALFYFAWKKNLALNTALAIMAVVAVLDVGSWAFRTPLNEIEARPGYVKFVNEIRTPQQEDILQFGGYGEGRAIAISAGQREKRGSCFRVFLSGKQMEWAIAFSALPLKRSYEISKRLGWTEERHCGHIGVVGLEEPFFTPERLNFTRALNIKYYFLDFEPDKRSAEDNGFRFLTHDEYSGFDLYEDTKAFPRVIWYSSAHIVKNFEDALIAFGSQNLFPQSAIVELEDNAKPTFLEKATAKNFTSDNLVVDYAPAKIVITGNSGQPGVLVLSDIHYPGWVAKVNGQESEIHPANILGRGVFVPAGEYVVTFEYRPWFLWIGAFVSGISWLGVMIYASLKWMSSRREPGYSGDAGH